MPPPPSPLLPIPWLRVSSSPVFAAKTKTAPSDDSAKTMHESCVCARVRACMHACECVCVRVRMGVQQNARVDGSGNISSVSSEVSSFGLQVYPSDFEAFLTRPQVQLCNMASSFSLDKTPQSSVGMMLMHGAEMARKGQDLEVRVDGRP